MADRKIRVLVCKPGLDGHDRGAKVVAASLRDAGMEVVYTGLRQTPAMIVESAMQEDVDAIGLSMHSAAHMTIFPRVRDLMLERGMDDVLLFGGGIIPEDDIPKLKELGVKYGPSVWDSVGSSSSSHAGVGAKGLSAACAHRPMRRLDVANTAGAANIAPSSRRRVTSGASRSCATRTRMTRCRPRSAR